MPYFRCKCLIINANGTGAIGCLFSSSHVGYLVPDRPQFFVVKRVSPQGFIVPDSRREHDLYLGYISFPGRDTGGGVSHLILIFWQDIEAPLFTRSSATHLILSPTVAGVGAVASGFELCLKTGPGLRRSIGVSLLIRGSTGPARPLTGGAARKPHYRTR